MCCCYFRLIIGNDYQTLCLPSGIDVILVDSDELNTGLARKGPIDGSHLEERGPLRRWRATSGAGEQACDRLALRAADRAARWADG